MYRPSGETVPGSTSLRGSALRTVPRSHRGSSAEPGACDRGLQVDPESRAPAVRRSSAPRRRRASDSTRPFAPVPVAASARSGRSATTFVYCSIAAFRSPSTSSVFIAALNRRAESCARRQCRPQHNGEPNNCHCETFHAITSTCEATRRFSASLHKARHESVTSSRSNRYPMPRTLLRNRGAAGDGSIFLRRLAI